MLVSALPLLRVLVPATACAAAPRPLRRQVPLLNLLRRNVASFLRVLEKFGALNPESHILVWGCSAGLRREDDHSLGAAFERVVYHKPFKEMILEKYHLRTHMESLTQAFRDAGIDACGVNGNISAAERSGTLTEGVDISGIDCVVLARPTRSSILLMQMFGRGLGKHKYPGGVEKADCLILDFVDETERDAGGCATVPSLLGLRQNVKLNSDASPDLITKTRKRKRKGSDLPAEIISRIGRCCPHRLALPTNALNRSLLRLFSLPIHIASRARNHTPSPQQPRHGGESAQTRALKAEATHGNIAVLQLLLDAAADSASAAGATRAAVTVTSPTPPIGAQSAPIAAAASSNIEGLRLLASHGADLRARGHAALVAAARGVVELCLASGGGRSRRSRRRCARLARSRAATAFATARRRSQPFYSQRGRRLTGGAALVRVLLAAGPNEEDLRRALKYSPDKASAKQSSCCGRRRRPKERRMKNPKGGNTAVVELLAERRPPNQEALDEAILIAANGATAKWSTVEVVNRQPLVGSCDVGGTTPSARSAAVVSKMQSLERCTPSASLPRPGIGPIGPGTPRNGRESANVELAREILEARPSLRSDLKKVVSAASSSGSVEAVELLLQLYAGTRNRSILWEAQTSAISRGHTDLMRLLLDSESNLPPCNFPSKKMHHEDILAWNAVNSGKADLLMLLLDQGLRFNRFSFLLLEGCRNSGKSAVVRLLLERGFSFSAFDLRKHVENLTEERMFDIAVCLLEHPTGRDGNSRLLSFLIIDPVVAAEVAWSIETASEKGHCSCVWVILDGGAPQEPALSKALEEAADNGHADIVGLLLRNRGHVAVVKKLLHRGAVANQISVGHALLSSSPEMLELILNTGVASARDLDRLVLQAGRDGPDMLRLTLKFGADAAAESSAAVVEAAKADSVTSTQDNEALVQAATKGHFDCVRLLLHRGADPTAQGGIAVVELRENPKGGPEFMDEIIQLGLIHQS
ncbi:hypothetical protein DFJ73DRAFT_955647 [Zopfochytrium polystomum]|nr:hypothetical protein DFJ73DRAFT_955647 [Zopfochytrium polystomum]